MDDLAMALKSANHLMESDDDDDQKLSSPNSTS